MAKNYTIHHVRGHHSSFDQREAIAMVYDANIRLPPGRRKSQNQLAKELGLAKSTFSREINRGRCDNPTFFAGRTFWEYSEHKAQDSVDEGNRNKGCPMKVTNQMAARLQELILKRGYSPNHARATMVSDHMEMCRAMRRINRFLKIYYTHAYAAWEKGSVENANRHIRRFYPKGTKFNLVSRNRIKELQDFLNSIPRTSLKGKSANESFLLVRYRTVPSHLQFTHLTALSFSGDSPPKNALLLAFRRIPAPYAFSLCPCDDQHSPATGLAAGLPCQHEPKPKIAETTNP